MPDKHTRTSKFMSLVLRHKPEVAGVRLDANGYVVVETLLRALHRNGHKIDRKSLDELVETNDKKRFAYDETGTLIRAVQGHSREVDLGYAPATPPDVLFHGTVDRFLASIRSEGLKPRGRQFVHLSGDHDTAVAVGQRRGKPVILTIDTAAMHRQGHVFYLASNGVWLTEAVPPGFIAVPE
jgi:putative RNA 2'-phosphotransferase